MSTPSQNAFTRYTCKNYNILASEEGLRVKDARMKVEMRRFAGAFLFLLAFAVYAVLAAPQTAHAVYAPLTLSEADMAGAQVLAGSATFSVTGADFETKVSGGANGFDYCPDASLAKVFKFTAPSTGLYSFEATSGLGTVGILYNSEGAYVASNDDGASSSDFNLVETLQAGQTYYLAASMYKPTTSGTITVSVSVGKVASGISACGSGFGYVDTAYGYAVYTPLKQAVFQLSYTDGTSYLLAVSPDTQKATFQDAYGNTVQYALASEEAASWGSIASGEFHICAKAYNKKGELVGEATAAYTMAASAKALEASAAECQVGAEVATTEGLFKVEIGNTGYYGSSAISSGWLYAEGMAGTPVDASGGTLHKLAAGTTCYLIINGITGSSWSFDYYVKDAPDCAHQLGLGQVTKEPTCTEDGVRAYTCQLCGQRYSATIAALGHSAADAVQEDVVEPTTEAVGSYNLVVRCSRCGDVLSSVPMTTPKLEPAPAENATGATEEESATGATEAENAMGARELPVLKANKITVKVASKKLSYKKVKKKKRTFSIGAKAKSGAKVRYAVSAKAKKAGVSVTKAGKVVVRKGTKKGRYVITLSCQATGTYKAAKRTVVLRIK